MTEPAATAAPQLPEDLVAHVQSGLSISLSGRDERLVASLAKAVGCRVADDRREVTMLVFAEAADAVLRDVARNGRLSVAFTQPSTNRTVQLKGHDARCVPTTPADLALARRWLALFMLELKPFGWQPEFLDAVFWHDPSQLMAIRFTVDSAFAQTPGPGAGKPMPLAPGVSGVMCPVAPEAGRAGSPPAGAASHAASSATTSAAPAVAAATLPADPVHDRRLRPPISLDTLRPCLEGVIPAVLATCALDGAPNTSYVSQMQYVDAQHVALTFQFFNKTRENILANPQATALVIDPITGECYRLTLLYLRTETAGALFQGMKAKLAGIASHTGMSGVFKLQGADVYHVQAIERVPGRALARPAPARHPLNALRSAGRQLADGTELGPLFDRALQALAQEFGISHALLLMADEAGQRLYTVASRGYSSTGVGSEIGFGEGVIGVAAEHRVPIRINHMTVEYGYGRTTREGAAAHGLAAETEIPFPGLAEPHSQLAVPLLAAGRLLGVLCVESPQDLRFGFHDEDALVALGLLLGGQVLALQQAAEADAAEPDRSGPAAAHEAAGAPPLEVRHYRATRSVFVGNDYLIKGVAGAILWKLLQTQAATGRCDFSNRELRAASDLGLPEISDNLEARLVLLQRRLAERCSAIALEKAGRGLLRLCLRQSLTLVDIDD